MSQHWMCRVVHIHIFFGVHADPEGLVFLYGVWRGGEKEGNYLPVLHNAALPRV